MCLVNHVEGDYCGASVKCAENDRSESISSSSLYSSCSLTLMLCLPHPYPYLSPSCWTSCFILSPALSSLLLAHPHPVSFYVKVSSSLNSRNVDREDERQKPPRFNNRLSVIPFSPPFFSNFLFYDLATCRNFIGRVIIYFYFYYSFSFAINLALYLLQQTSLRPVDIPPTLEAYPSPLSLLVPFLLYSSPAFLFNSPLTLYYSALASLVPTHVPPPSFPLISLINPHHLSNPTESQDVSSFDKIIALEYILT
jgi:hypothetical protein